MSASWHPFTDPRVDDCVGWLAEDLLPSEPPWTKTVTERDGDLVRYFDTKRGRVKTCVLATWRRWCSNNQPRCISKNHLEQVDRCYCIGGPVGRHKPTCKLASTTPETRN